MKKVKGYAALDRIQSMEYVVNTYKRFIMNDVRRLDELELCYNGDEETKEFMEEEILDDIGTLLLTFKEEFNHELRQLRKVIEE